MLQRLAIFFGVIVLLAAARADIDPEVEKLAQKKTYHNKVHRWGYTNVRKQNAKRDTLNQAVTLAMRTLSRAKCGNIAIIGTGMSAMSAANRIFEINPTCKVTMFEARDRLGGRTYWIDGMTDTTEGADSQVGGNGQWVKNSDYEGDPVPRSGQFPKGFDLGGQWCHMDGDDNPLSRLIKRADLKTSNVGEPYGDDDHNTLFYDAEAKFNDVEAVREEGTERPVIKRDAYINSMHDAHDLFKKAQNLLIEQQAADPGNFKDKTAADAITELPEWQEILAKCSRATPESKLCLKKNLLWLHFMIIVDFEGAETLKHTGLTAYEHNMIFPSSETDAEMVDDLGMFGTTNYLYQGIKNYKNFKLKLGCKVLKVVSSHVIKAKLTWRCKNDDDDDEKESFKVYDKVLSTVPFGVLKRDHETLFPELPKEKKAILNMPEPAPLLHGTLNKLILIFSECWWPNEDYIFFFLNTGESRFKSIVNFCHASSKKQPVLIFFTAATDAHEVEKLSPKAQKNQALAQLRKMFPDLTVPEPAEIVVTRWFNDPHAAGSYLTLGLGGTQETIKTLRKNDGAIHYAGEWTDPYRYGFVYGAYISGQREAFAIVGPHDGVRQPRERIEHIYHLYDTNTQNKEIFELDPRKLVAGTESVLQANPKMNIYGRGDIKKMANTFRRAHANERDNKNDVVRKTLVNAAAQKMHIGIAKED